MIFSSLSFIRHMLHSQPRGERESEKRQEFEKFHDDDDGMPISEQLTNSNFLFIYSANSLNRSLACRFVTNRKRVCICV